MTLAYSLTLASFARLPWTLVIVCLVSLPVSAQVALAQDESETPAAKLAAMASAVRISTPQGRLLGCGVVIHKGEREFDVLTAEHIVRASPQLLVECYAPGKADQTGQIFQHRNVEVLSQDARADLARIRVKSGIPPAAVLEQIPAEQTQQLTELVSAGSLSAWVVEWSRAEQLQVRQVRVERRHTARRTQAGLPVSFWELTEPSISGMSGGALVSQAGQLLGIASGNSGQHAYYADETEVAGFLAK